MWPIRRGHVGAKGGPARLADSPGGPPIDLSQLAANSLAPITAALAVLLAFALVTLFVQDRRIRRLQRRLSALTRGETGGDLEGVLSAHLERVVALGRQVDGLTARTAVLEATTKRSFQRIGLVRFNPFEDTGGNQSFALAVLDADDDGFVVSSLHGRNGTRIYAKGISRGRPEASLSGEESEAIARARDATSGRAALADRAGLRTRAVTSERPTDTAPADRRAAESLPAPAGIATPGPDGLVESGGVADTGSRPGAVGADGDGERSTLFR